MKLLVIAADALIPDYIFGKRELFSNISELISIGTSAEYSAYVQRNYYGSYSSAQNWASIYTGMPPYEHGVDISKTNDEYKHPEMSEFDDFEPIWKVLNDNGFSIGLFQPACCNSPVSIDGYCVTSMYSPVFTATSNREAKRHLQVNEKDKWIFNLLDGEPPPRVYPKTLAQLGVSFLQLKENPCLADELYSEYRFTEVVENFRDELDYWKNNVINVYKKSPVDVVWFYTPSTDIIPHFVLHEDNCSALIDCYKLLDAFIGDLVKEFHPENVMVMSDHGQANFIELVKCSDPDIQREAFSKSEEALWLNNGYIAFEASNGGLLLTTHSLKGVFIASGQNIRNTNVSEMRTLDIYPTILEVLDVKVPDHRSGFVVDIFDRTLVNPARLLKTVPGKRIAIIQSYSVDITDIFINEIYIENRFSSITIIGEEKYGEIFLNNPRVTGFIPFEEYDAAMFSQVYCCIYNTRTNLMRHLRVK